MDSGVFSNKGPTGRAGYASIGTVFRQSDHRVIARPTRTAPDGSAYWRLVINSGGNGQAGFVCWVDGCSDRE